MKKEINRRVLVLSSCVTGVYCALCFLSAGLVCYGALAYDLNLFSVGKMLVPFWLLNPMGVVVALIAMRKNNHKAPFLMHIVLDIVCWFVAGIINVCFF